MNTKISLSIESIHGQGVSVQPIIEGLKALKQDLEIKGAQVSVTIGGYDLSEIILVSLTPPENCFECEGMGRTKRDEPCKWCNGTGRAGEWL